MALSANEVIEQNLYAAIIADASISALIGTRFYPLVAKQNPPRDATTGKVLPYGTYQRISASPRVRSHQGVSGLSRVRFQMNWIGSQEDDGTVDYATAIEIADAVRIAFDGFSGTLTAMKVGEMRLESDTDRYDDELQRTYRQQDWVIWHNEATS